MAEAAQNYGEKWSCNYGQRRLGCQRRRRCENLNGWAEGSVEGAEEEARKEVQRGFSMQSRQRRRD